MKVFIIDKRQNLRDRTSPHFKRRQCRCSNNLDDKRSDVVPRAAGQRGFDHAPRRARLGPGGRRRPQILGQMLVVQPFHQTIRAKQKDVALFVCDRAYLRFDKLIGTAQRLLQNVPARMAASFPFVDLALTQQPADVRIVVRDLFDRVFPRGQIINPAVTDVAEIKPAGSKPAQAQGRFHPGAFLIAAPEQSQRPVDLVEQLFQHFGKTARQSAAACLKERGSSRAIFSVVMRLAYSPALAPPMPMAKYKLEYIWLDGYSPSQPPRQNPGQRLRQLSDAGTTPELGL
jgi:hypothetical protein